MRAIQIQTVPRIWPSFVDSFISFGRKECKYKPRLEKFIAGGYWIFSSSIFIWEFQFEQQTIRMFVLWLEIANFSSSFRLLLNFTSNAIKLGKWTEIFYPQNFYHRLNPMSLYIIVKRHLCVSPIHVSYFRFLIHEYNKMNKRWISILPAARVLNFNSEFSYFLLLSLSCFWWNQKLLKQNCILFCQFAMDSNQLKNFHFDLECTKGLEVKNVWTW